MESAIQKIIATLQAHKTVMRADISLALFAKLNGAFIVHQNFNGTLTLTNLAQRILDFSAQGISLASIAESFLDTSTAEVTDIFMLYQTVSFFVDNGMIYLSDGVLRLDATYKRSLK